MNQSYQDYLNSGHWKRIRAYRLKLDEWQCVKCHSPYFLEVHHLVYAENLRNTSVQDLRTLCKFCHAETHGKTPTPEWVKAVARDSQPKIIEKPNKLRHKLFLESNKSAQERRCEYERKERADRDKVKFGSKGWAPIAGS